MPLRGRGRPTGSFHEAVNLAALWRLPCLFVITNNGYGMGTSVERSNAEPELHKRSVAYKIPRGAGGRAGRAGGAGGYGPPAAPGPGRAPALHPGVHDLPLPGPLADRPRKGYRSAEEIDSWRQRDPILLFGERLRERGLLSSEEAQRVAEDVDREVQEAIDFALQSPIRTRRTSTSTSTAPRPRSSSRGWPPGPLSGSAASGPSP